MTIWLWWAESSLKKLLEHAYMRETERYLIYTQDMTSTRLENEHKKNSMGHHNIFFRARAFFSPFNERLFSA